MVLIQLYKTIRNKVLPGIGISLILVLFCFSASAQEDPPRPLQIRTFQNLSFGAIIQGTIGGKVYVDPQGSRNVVSGDIFLANLGFQYHQAIFEVEAIPGSIITVLYGPDITLTGNHGGTLSLHVGPCYPSSPFINTSKPPFRTQVQVGGTLTIGNKGATPSGDYIGTFSVTFVQQ